MEDGPVQASGSPLAACAVAAVVGLLVWRAEDLAVLASGQDPWHEVTSAASGAPEDGATGSILSDDPAEDAASRGDAGVEEARLPGEAPAPDVVAAVGPPGGAAPNVAAVAAPPPVPSGDAPAFDVVRVARDGGALVAGQAEPGARVRIRTGGLELAEAEADAQGKFVAIFRADPSPDPRALTLDAEAGDGSVSTSSEVVVLLPEAASGGDEGAAAGAKEGGASGPAGAPDPAGEAGSATAREAQDGAGIATAHDARDGAVDTTEGFRSAAGEGPAQEADEGPGPRAKPEDAIAATTIVRRAKPEGGIAATAILRPGSLEVLPRDEVEGGTTLTLASISYARAGRVTLAGFGVAGAQVRAYVDDAYAQGARVAADGLWKLELGDLDAGLYRLRIDQMGSDGAVASRIETPFQRDFPPVPEASAATAQPASVIVQPGNNLWTLARIHYGRGVLYTQIFTANQPLIRDPALIYPGQIFALPEAAEVR